MQHDNAMYPQPCLSIMFGPLGSSHAEGNPQIHSELRRVPNAPAGPFYTDAILPPIMNIQRLQWGKTQVAKNSKVTEAKPWLKSPKPSITECKEIKPVTQISGGCGRGASLLITIKGKNTRPFSLGIGFLSHALSWLLLLPPSNPPQLKMCCNKCVCLKKKKRQQSFL